MEKELIRTVPRPKSAFQGWRYLTQADAPLDERAAGFAEEGGSSEIAE
jgi:hypothetical protein